MIVFVKVIEAGFLFMEMIQMDLSILCTISFQKGHWTTLIAQLCYTTLLLVRSVMLYLRISWNGCDSAYDVGHQQPRRVERTE